MVRRRLAFGLVGSLAAASLLLAVGAAGAAGSNADAAHACLAGGYATLTRADGSSFRNAGECTSYAARGGDIPGIGPACAFATNSGCVVFDAVVLGNIVGPPVYSIASARTYTISGTWIFSPTCQNGISGCDYSTIAISGNGTYSAFDGTGVVESGTWAASFSPPDPYSFQDGGFASTTCSASVIQMLTARLSLSGSGAAPWVEVRFDSTATGPSKNFVMGFFGSGTMPGGWFHTGTLSGVTLGC